jgi:hypothetical protein
MMPTNLLLKAVNARVKIWDFMDIYPNRDIARREAARLFVNNYNGVQVKQTRPKSFLVLAWKMEEL